MKREHVYLAILSIGLLAVAIVWMPRSSDDKRPMLPPAELQRQVQAEAAPEKRVYAAQGLLSHGPQARQEIRQSLAVSHDAPPEVRQVLLQAAMKARDWRSLPEIFRAMEDRDVWVRGRAGAAAKEIMGVDFGFRANDPPEKRSEVMRLIRQEYQDSQRLYKRFYQGQETSP